MCIVKVLTIPTNVAEVEKFMTSLVICRHGNTFRPEDPPRRIGRNTDIPLTKEGLRQAEALGVYMAHKALIPTAVFSSPLQRTQQMAERILNVLDLDLSIQHDERFNEISYGPDENQKEEDVIRRIGQEALERWNKKAIAPKGWDVNPEQIKQDWANFAQEILVEYPEQVVLVVTSNGVGRFAPYITGDYERFRKKHNIKLKTGALGVFEYDGSNWQVMEWNTRP